MKTKNKTTRPTTLRRLPLTPRPTPDRFPTFRQARHDLLFLSYYPGMQPPLMTGQHPTAA